MERRSLGLVSLAETSRIHVLVGLVVASVAACGGQSADADGPTVEQFCEAKARRECVVATACTVGEEPCVTARREACGKQVAAAALDARYFSGVRATDCLLTIDRAFQGGRVPAWELDETADGSMANVCGQMFVGTRAIGDACDVNGQCEPGLVCAKAAQGSVCAKRRVFAEDEPCGNPGDDCEEGLYCNRASAVARCVPRKAAGEECSDAVPCLEGLRCDGVCRAKQKLGEACKASQDCAGDAPFCDPYAGSVCGPALIFTGASPVCLEFGKRVPEP